MGFIEDALAIANLLKAKFGGIDWDFVRQNLNAYMLSELYSFLDTGIIPKSDFPATLQQKLLAKFKPPEIKNLFDTVNIFLNNSTIGII